MKDQLTPEQTQFIAGYSYQQGVMWYDVELEVVDHIAAWAEHEMATNGLSFDEVYEKMKITFPEKDLLEIVNSKKKSIARRISRMIEKEFLTFFRLPKIFLTAMLIAFSIYLPTFFSLQKMGVLFAFLLNLFIFAVFSPQIKKINSIKELQRCKLLSVKVKSPYEWIIMGFVIIFALMNLLRIGLPEKAGSLTGSRATEIIILQSATLFFALSCLLVYCTNVVRRNILTRLMQQYPYAFTE